MPGRPGVPAPAKAETPAPKGRRNSPATRPERRAEQRVERPISRTVAAAAAPVEPQRIARLLARAGVASRRDIERMISEGRIAIHGEVITTPATIVKSLDGITVNGLTITAMEPTRLFRFHKPGGVLTTARDPGGRPTIFDILPPGLPRTVPVGRLDMNTEGLLLLTTDGALKRALELPSSGVPRSYRVRAYGEIHQRVLENLIDGITIEGVHYGPIDAGIERRTGRNLWIGMTLTEGKNREIRRVLEHLGLQVSRLIRTRYGPIHLDDLPPRGVDEVPPQLVAQLINVLKRGPDAA
jgi:23S rRNA pseudouridine2605 synthase